MWYVEWFVLGWMICTKLNDLYYVEWLVLRLMICSYHVEFLLTTLNNLHFVEWFILTALNLFWLRWMTSTVVGWFERFNETSSWKIPPEYSPRNFLSHENLHNEHCLIRKPPWKNSSSENCFATNKKQTIIFKV